MFNSFLDLSIATIEKALVIRKQIEALQGSLIEILGGKVLAASFEAPVTRVAPVTKGRRTMSAAGRARVAAAQRARWAKTRAASAPAQFATKATGTTKAAKAPRKKRTMSPEARARIAAAQRARWAKQKAA